MAIRINSAYIVRKQELILKDSREGLNTEEKTELEEIEQMLRKIYKEINELNSKGVEFDNKPLNALKVEVKEKLKPQERREKALELVAIYKEKGYDEKQIIKTVRVDLGVSYTYVYNLLKEAI